MAFVKEDLTGEHYSWSNETSFAGTPSRRLFDRFNGHQVLFILNSLHEESEKFNLQECNRVEELLLDKLPTDIRSELSVYNWLRGLR